MPNWCSNKLIISVINSHKESIDQLNIFREIAESDKSDLSMKNIIRIPSDLNIECGSVGMIYDAYYGDWEQLLVYPWVAEFINNNNLEFNQESIIKAVENKGYTKEQADQRKRNFEKYGCTNWRDWSIKNWGTKWDVQASLEEMTDEMLVYSFDSAWNPPLAFVEKVAELFPLLNFLLEFKEGGMGFAGEFYGNHESGFVTNEWEYSCEDEEYD